MLESLLSALAGMAPSIIAVIGTFVVRDAFQDIDPMPVAMMRLTAVACIVLLAWLPCLKKHPIPPWRDTLKIAGLGVFGVTIGQICFLVGLQESTPARCLLLYALTPLFVLILSAALKQDILTWRRFIAALMALVGVGIILSGKSTMAGATLRGDLIILCAVIGWAVYTALGRSFLMRYGTARVTGLAFMGGMLAALPFGWQHLVSTSWMHVSLRAWFAIAWLVFLSSLAAYYLWYVALRRLSPARLGIYMNVQPVLGTLGSWYVYHEPITLSFFIGALLILGGVAITQQSKA